MSSVCADRVLERSKWFRTCCESTGVTRSLLDVNSSVSNLLKREEGCLDSPLL